MSDAPFPDPLAQLRRRWDADRSSRLFLQLAEEYRHRGNLREALSVLDEGLKGHPGYLSALVAKGRCHLELGQPSEARAALDRVVRQDPTQEVASKLLVRALVELGATSDARERLRVYCLLHERDPEVLDLERRIAAAEAPILATTSPEPLEGSESLESSSPSETVEALESIADGVPSAATPAEVPTSIRGSQTMTEDLFDLAPAPPALPTFSPNDDLFGLYREDLLAHAVGPVPTPAAEESLFPQLDGGADRGRWLSALSQEGLFDFGAVPSAQTFEPPPPIESPRPLEDQAESVVSVPFDADETLDVLQSPLGDASAAPLEARTAFAPFLDDQPARSFTTIEPEGPENDELDLEVEAPLETATSGSVATVTLAELYLRQGHHTEAERIFREVLAREPENASAHEGLAALSALAAPPPSTVAEPPPVEMVWESDLAAEPIAESIAEPVAEMISEPIVATNLAAAVQEEVPSGDPTQRKISKLTAYLERLRRGRARLVS